MRTSGGDATSSKYCSRQGSASQNGTRFSATLRLEQPGDAAVAVDVDVVRGRNLRQSRHGHDVATDHDHELRARGEPHLANVDHVVCRRAAQLRVGGEGILRLGDAYRVVTVAALLQLANLRAHLGV